MLCMNSCVFMDELGCFIRRQCIPFVDFCWYLMVQDTGALTLIDKPGSLKKHYDFLKDPTSGGF